MQNLLRTALTVAVIGATGLVSAPAMAHHGWAWTQDGFFQIEGTVKSVFYGNPHPVLEIEVDGAVWRVELAPPGASTAAGFLETTAEVGDAITAIGNRSQNSAETRMKAVRLVLDGVNYDVYPDRAKAITGGA